MLLSETKSLYHHLYPIFYLTHGFIEFDSLVFILLLVQIKFRFKYKFIIYNRQKCTLFINKIRTRNISFNLNDGGVQLLI